ncbi:hypothetical protein [Palaeococcus ferrophilus]|uniref:hypothetical protein n=1 Tax=Palaeococcus ferrophilus TaxID=83868 RepID=UPI00064E7D5F|nr:hypothetical protein [Palaeococcus ferrophilus]
MAVPAFAMAYKEKDDIIRLIAYAFVGIAVLYMLYKLFGAFRSLGEKIEKTLQGVKEGLNEVAEYGVTKPVTPEDTKAIIEKRASKEPEKPYLVEKSIYEGLKEQGKELPKNVKPYSLKGSIEKAPIKTERKTTPAIGSKLGLWTTKKEEPVKIEKPVKSESEKLREEIMKFKHARGEKLKDYHHTLPLSPPAYMR